RHGTQRAARSAENRRRELRRTHLHQPQRHFLTQLAARWMLERGEGIVFVTSISAYTAPVNRAEYCISKAGLSISVALYAERLASAGIKVFKIRPGIIRTDMISKVEKLHDEKIAASLARHWMSSAPSPTACWTTPRARCSM